MNHHQREQRRIAARAFLESLDQLGKSMHGDEPTCPESPQAECSIESSIPTLDALEAAADDIDHFMQTKDATP